MIQISCSQLVNYIKAAWNTRDIKGIPDMDTAILKVDHNMALIYTNWKSYKYSQLTHDGVMVYLFAKVDGEWKICGSMDNLKAK